MAISPSFSYGPLPRASIALIGRTRSGQLVVTALFEVNALVEKSMDHLLQLFGVQLGLILGRVTIASLLAKSSFQLLVQYRQVSA
ncbi:hypothetical protein ACUN0G_11980 [Pseudomonas sp. 32A]|uniref:hypothetical protein n=1 Tax=Pseudomonas sp. 32A TaxID=651185 RepID=UPI004045FAC6